MKTLQTRFGEITYDPDKVVRFPEGLAGFEKLHDFVVMPAKRKDDPVLCFQSVEEPHIAFLLVNPVLFFPDYSVPLETGVFEKLGISTQDPYFILSMITFHENESITLNLLAPVIYTPKTDRAVQVILEKSSHSAKTPLPGRG